MEQAWSQSKTVFFAKGFSDYLIIYLTSLTIFYISSMISDHFIHPLNSIAIQPVPFRAIPLLLSLSQDNLNLIIWHYRKP